jgi:hypothetical protein
MIPLITAVFLACMPQTPLQIQQREIHEQGTHYAVGVKYPEIENADAFNAAVRLAVVRSLRASRKDGCPRSTQVTVLVTATSTAAIPPLF